MPGWVGDAVVVVGGGMFGSRCGLVPMREVLSKCGEGGCGAGGVLEGLRIGLMWLRSRSRVQLRVS